MMKLLLNTTPTFYAPSDADAAAKTLNASDEDWKYVAVHAPQGKGYSRVKAFDENGKLVGFM